MIKEKCIEFIEQDGREWCTKLIRLRAVGAILFVELVKRDAARLWKKYRDRFTANKLPYLVASVAGAIAQEIRDETEEVATFTEHTVAKLNDALLR